MPAFPAHALTLLFVALAWTLFRAPDLGSALSMYAGQFGLHSFGLGDALAVTLRPAHGIAAMLLIRQDDGLISVRSSSLFPADAAKSNAPDAR